MAAFGSEHIGRVLGGRYRIVAPLGTGASATVLRAEDVQLKRSVALKLLHPSLADDPAFLKRFRAEAQAAANLNHPNIMAVYDWGEDAGTPYLVLEYLAGGSLRAILDRGRRLSPSQALLVGLEAARGLDYAHTRGVVHRDIKPANLLFGEDSRLRIADFGLARAIAEAAWTEPDGVVLGTAKYASPEQAKGLPVDGKTDVYSLALTLVEAVTGSVPFAADTTVATLMGRIDKLLPVSADLGPLATVLERAGRPHPEERFDAGALGQALLAVAERMPRPAPLPLVSTPTRPVGDRTTLSPEMAAGPDPTIFNKAAGTELPPEPVVVAPVAAAEPPAPEPAPAVAAPSGGRERSRIRRFLLAAGVLLVAAGIAVGVLVFQRLNVKNYAVPNLVGLDYHAAENQVSDYGWKVDVKQQKSDEQPAVDKVFKQSPDVGTKLKKGSGSHLTLYVSDGPTLSALPTIVAKSVDDATATLAKVGLTLNVASQAFDEAAPPGQVLSYTVKGQTVAAGMEIPKGTAIDVVTSKGPAPRTIPQIAGKPFPDVKAQLEQMGLVVNQAEDVFSDKYAPGTVAHIEPVGQGGQVPKGATVTINVSKGPDVVNVPDVYGMTLQDAVAALQAGGCAQGTITGPIDKRVIKLSPDKGVVVKRGTPINITLG